MTTKNDLIVFDLDGTLANHKHRIHFLEGKQKDFDTYHDMCIYDTPHIEAVELFHMWIDRGYNVQIWTGRTDRVRPETEIWLKQKCGIRPFALVNMRPDKLHTPDYELKKSWMDTQGKPYLVFEDRNRVVRMWRENGVRCYHVEDGDF